MGGSLHVVVIGLPHAVVMGSPHVVVIGLPHAVVMGSLHVVVIGLPHAVVMGSPHVVVMGLPHVVATRVVISPLWPMTIHWITTCRRQHGTPQRSTGQKARRRASQASTTNDSP